MSKLLIGAALVALASPAAAQDGDRGWTGAYVGGRIGYSFQPSDGEETINFDNNLDGRFGDVVRTAAGANAFSPGFCGGAARTAVPSTGCSKDHDSLEWAIHAGYDYDFGGPVVGALIEGGIGYAEDSVSAYSTTPAYYTMTRRMKENAAVRLRAGYAFGPERRTLVYGTGGYVIAKMSNEHRSSNLANSFRTFGDEKVDGYRVGGGVEHRFVGAPISLGLQYLFTSLADDGARVAVTRGSAPANNPFLLVNAGGTNFARSHSRFATHNVSLTANLRF